MQAYTLRSTIFDPIEQSLFRALTLVLCQRALLFAKISLSDLLTIPSYGATPTELAQLAHYPVDFVLCDREATRPLAVIFLETDGNSGNEYAVETSARICTAAGLPVIRLQRQHNYMMPYLSSIIEPLLTSGTLKEEHNTEQRTWDLGNTTVTLPLKELAEPKRARRQPAYPGYGVLRTLANKLS